MKPVRVVVAEERSLFRQGIGALIRLIQPDLCGADPSYDVVGEAGSLETLRMVCARVSPDLVVMSARLAGAASDWSRVVACLQDDARRVSVILLGEEPNEIGAARRLAAQAGAVAYLPVTVEREELARALRFAVTGPPGGEEPSPPLHRRAGASHPITERERAIIHLVTHGLCNKEIACRLGIGAQTVKNHVSHLLEKLALADRTQLAVYALEHGLEPCSDQRGPSTASPDCVPT